MRKHKDVPNDLNNSILARSSKGSPKIKRNEACPCCRPGDALKHREASTFLISGLPSRDLQQIESFQSFEAS